MSAILDFVYIRMIADKIDTNNDQVITKDELKAWITHSAKTYAAGTGFTCNGQLINFPTK